jgi:hypothetical protein
MQTDIRMEYSDSSHFSDKIAYKILFIWSCGLRYDLYKICRSFGKIANREG